MVNNVGVYIQLQNYYNRMTIAGAMDIEPDFGPPGPARSWAEGYNSVHNYDYFNFGSCDGCPFSGCLSCTPLKNWTLDDIVYVSWGVPSAWPLPEIYATDGSLADQWYRVSLRAATNWGGRMNIRGSMTQWQACQGQSCPGTDNTPATGWGQLAQWLNLDSRTAQFLEWSTDISWAN